MRIGLSHGAPLRSRVERCLPALASWRGQRPAQEIRCPTLGKRVMSVPISATRIYAAVVLTPGIVTRWATAARHGARAAPISSSSSAPRRLDQPGALQLETEPRDLLRVLGGAGAARDAPP